MRILLAALCATVLATGCGGLRTAKVPLDTALEKAPAHRTPTRSS
jgi:hypothetical protein